ncbi:hypothetical protein GCM10020000_86350 [Streptomyces olivoverticillatus]
MPGLRSFFHVEFPRPDVAGRTVCPACEGWGVSGERVERETTERLPLLADVMCRQCGGCGCADHEECPPKVSTRENHPTSKASSWRHTTLREMNW